MSSWHSYPKIWNMGHAQVKDLFKDPVLIEEKVDGSQFSFGFIDGKLRCRSRGQELNVDAPERMFIPAVETAQRLQAEGKLLDGWTYRGEYLSKPKHNVLAYNRIPKACIILFDVNTGQESYLSRAEKEQIAADLGLEIVPKLFEGVVTDQTMFEQLLSRESYLGGPRIEGVVAKSYGKFGADGHALMAKYVSEEFKEKHGKEWKKIAPGQGDIIETLVANYKSEARWAKAVQHLREAGKLTDSPRDIGPLIREVQSDVLAESESEIKQQLFDWAWPRIERSIIARLPEWYKARLLDAQFAPSAKDAFVNEQVKLIAEQVKLIAEEMMETHKELFQELAKND